MFAEALGGLGELDALFFVPAQLAPSYENAQAFGRALRRYWGFEVGVTLCAQRPFGGYRNALERYVLPALIQSRLPVWGCASGKEHLRALEGCLDRGYDAVFVHRLAAMHPFLNCRRRLRAVFFDLDDIEHVAFRRDIDQPPKWRSKSLLHLQIPALMFAERRAAGMARRTFVCSERDRRYLSYHLGFPRVDVVPNGIEMPRPAVVASSPTMLFAGMYSYQPNARAAEYLLRDIWPLVLKAVPEARLLLAGARPDCIPGYGQPMKGVTFLGFVPDLKDLYDRTRVVCCPILAGGGTRVKIVEAAAFGKAVVSTTIGAEGLEFVKGREIVICDDPASFAEACIGLLKDEERCRRFGVAARAAAEKLYDRQGIMKRVQTLVSQECQNAHMKS